MVVVGANEQTSKREANKRASERKRTILKAAALQFTRDFRESHRFTFATFGAAAAAAAPPLTH